MTLNQHGHVVNSQIEGCISMKSYLDNNNRLKMGLNDDLQIGKRSHSGPQTGVLLDDCIFHECLDL